MVCLLLAIFALFGYFHKEALFITWFCSLLKGLLGYGFWLSTPALLLGAYILAFHRGRPVRLRLCCALLLPLALSCLLHGLLVSPMTWDGQLLGRLWVSGLSLKSGGAVGGLLAQCCVSLFTDLGCTIVFALAAILMGLAAFNRSIVDVADWVFSRPEYDYEPEPQPRRPRQKEPREVKQQAPRQEPPRPRASRPSIDIPVDDPPIQPEPEPQPETEKDRKSVV